MSQVPVSDWVLSGVVSTWRPGETRVILKCTTVTWGREFGIYIVYLFQEKYKIATACSKDTIPKLHYEGYSWMSTG